MNLRLRAGSSLAVLCCAWLFACGSDGNKEPTEKASADAGAPEMSQRPADDSDKSNKKDAGDSSAMTATGKASCDDEKCASPATCELRDDKPVCVCPSGYDDVKGDGSECKDKDECADSSVCDKHATCTNTPGGYECKCKGPAYAQDGKSCKCADGYSEHDGMCLADDAGKCSDNLDCVNGHCVSGVCCASACDKPDAECRTGEGATCADGKTCKYAMAADGAACDDGDACMEDSTCKGGKCQPGTRPLNCDDQNPCTADSCDKQVGCKNVGSVEGKCDDGNKCTSNDACKAGSCVGTAVDCASARDACNDGVCDPGDGTCHKKPARDGATCDDADSCSLGDRCAAGSCKGPDSACGPNATACMPGASNTCTCKEGYVASGGLCVPMNDECAANPCSPNATCFDPSNNAGDVTCKCKADYLGDGKNCVPKDPCKDNPCGDGRGTCTAGAAGAYTCSCTGGFKPVGGTCACDLTGTFAGRSTFDQSWSRITGFEDGHVTTYNWLIERNQVAADGSIDAELILCGESSVDLCGTALGNEAYAQFLPRNYYDAGATNTKLSYRIEKPLPGSTYETPAYALLAGISLTDPLGAWPTSRKNIQGGPDFSGTAVNGARWVDMDNDSFYGLTTYAVGPDGFSADGDGPRPLTSYGPTSADCPRSNPNAKRDPYAYVPAADGLIVRRVKRFYTASRTINVMRGKLDSCDAFSGDVRGPNGADISQVDGVLGGCIRVNGDGETACSASIVDFVTGGGASATQMTNSSKYTFKRVADNVTCADVRALSF